MKPVLEHIAPDNDQSFYLGRFEQTSFTFPWHYHPEWELTFIVEGSGTAYTGNMIRHFTSGELTLIGPNLPHCWKSNPPLEQGVKSVFIQWDENMLGKNGLASREFSAIRTLLAASYSGVIFEGEQAQEIGQELLKLEALAPLPRLLRLLGLLDRLAALPQRVICTGDVVRYHNTTASKRIERILNYIAERYTEKISADDMAALTHMTRVSFSKYFTRTFNKSFTHFLNEYRITQACGMLIDAELAVDDIAERCGYQNMAYFHRQFKAVMATTPLKYRQHYRKIV